MGSEKGAAGVRRAWRMWALFVLGGLLVGFAVSMLDGHPQNSSFRHALRVLVPRGAVDSWAPMLEAIRFLRENPGERIYQVLFFEQHIKFQYPLTSLVGFDLLQRAFSVGTDTLLVAAQVISRACVPLIGLVFSALLIDASRSPAERNLPLSLPQWLAAMAAGTASAICFYPIALSETLGQIQTIMTLLAALGLWAWLRGAPVAAGVCIGLCCIVKPHWLVIVPWAMLRRQWGLTAAIAGTTALFGVLAIAMYGLQNVLDYAAVASYIGQRGEAFFDNQTMNGLINRALLNGSNVAWTANSFAPYHPLVYGVTLVSTVALLGFGLLFGRTATPTALHLGLVMLALTMASPIAWTHHYGVLFPIFALALPAVLERRPWGVASVPALFVAYVLVSQSLLDATRPLADSRLNVLQSYVFFGGLLMLALLTALLRGAAARPQSAGALAAPGIPDRT
ncbi:glycosyltransferase family 87 protein [Variovorax dokdonensis]|uniref:Glycosyltransferase family 87 protein n=1 Tax=Variovorax dokdonensis TaxID=344883 RepID=A0ABT7NDB7_9BURK|nr:glycosyltransferase family 87 protein [Variovorax dokdonensis]MDM0045923.1 glycosyltransferase family 87 protein [Variovorax dokdonensis]